MIQDLNALDIGFREETFVTLVAKLRYGQLCHRLRSDLFLQHF